MVVVPLCDESLSKYVQQVLKLLMSRKLLQSHPNVLVRFDCVMLGLCLTWAGIRQIGGCQLSTQDWWSQEGRKYV